MRIDWESSYSENLDASRERMYETPMTQTEMIPDIPDSKLELSMMSGTELRRMASEEYALNGATPLRAQYLELAAEKDRMAENPSNITSSEQNAQLAGMDIERARSMYLDKAGEMESKARALRAEANRLERNSNPQPSRIEQLRREANRLDQEAKNYKRMFQHAISFGASYSSCSTDELQRRLKTAKRNYERNTETAKQMIMENARGFYYNPKNLISDHQYAAKKNQRQIAEIESELRKRK